jgi:hypothetical protein
MNLSLMLTVLYLINYVLSDYSSKESHFYFLLCMRGYQHLARHMPFIRGVMQSISSIAIAQGTILPKDARKLLREVKAEGMLSNNFYSAYPVDLNLASTDLETASMERLAEKFNIMSLEEEPTSSGAMTPACPLGEDRQGLSITLMQDWEDDPRLSLTEETL